MQDNFELNGMKIKSIVVGPVQTNCYILSNIWTKEAIIVDPGEEADKIISYIRSEGLAVKAVLLTHGHFDHIGAVNQIRNEFHVDVYAHEAEQDVLENSVINCSGMSGGEPITVFDAVLVKDGQKLSLAGFEAEVLFTPGHTHGSVCYYFKKNSALFSGDTLFMESVGRTDLPTGNSSAILKAIKEKLAVLAKETYVFTGHGSATTIGYETANNPYMSDLDF